MRVVYVAPIWEQVDKAIDDAQAAGKLIQEIVLTKAEMKRFVDHWNALTRWTTLSPAVSITEYRGVTVREEA